MPADDDRRAEIEAVARALAENRWRGQDLEMAMREYGGPNGWLMTDARTAIRALDRVRGARGDDERPGAHLPFGGDGQDYPARQPQGEDHDPDERALDTPLGARQRAQTQRDIADILQFGSPQDEDHEGHGVLQEDNDTGVLGEPQGEDHETGRARFGVCDVHGRVPVAIGSHDQAEICPYCGRDLARVSSSRPEQPPPDTLGGQPPAEPPEAP